MGPHASGMIRLRRIDDAGGNLVSPHKKTCVIINVIINYGCPTVPDREEAAGVSIAVLYRAHCDWLQGWLNRRLHDNHQAADLMQDTFLALLARRQVVPDVRQPRAFLSTIARGLLIDFWRRRDIEQAWADALAALPEVTHPSPEVQAQALQVLVGIDRKLHRLGARARSAFLMHRIHGMTHLAIAAELGVSERSVRHYIADAMLCLLRDSELGTDDLRSEKASR